MSGCVELSNSLRNVDDLLKLSETIQRAFVTSTFKVEDANWAPLNLQGDSFLAKERDCLDVDALLNLTPKIHPQRIEVDILDGR